MTVQELYSAVAGLTGDNALESAKWFYQALNRSLKQLNRIKPFEKHVTLHFSPPNVICEDDIHLQNTGTKEYEIADAAAVNCRICGKATITFTVGTDQVEKTIDSGNTYSLAIENYNILSLFDIDEAPETLIVEVEAQEESQIRLMALDSTIGLSAVYNGEYLVYDVSAMVNDFVSFTDMPMESLHAEECGYRFSENEVMIPADSEADDIEIYYRAKTAVVAYNAAPESDTTVITVRSDHEDLLELLCAYYVNQYSDPDVAAGFLADYQRELAVYMTRINVAKEERLVDRSGWLK